MKYIYLYYHDRPGSCIVVRYEVWEEFSMTDISVSRIYFFTWFLISTESFDTIEVCVVKYTEYSTMKWVEGSAV